MPPVIKLLIHNHAIAFKDQNQVWINSSIGIWVNELSKYFSQIGLLLFESTLKQDFHDYQIDITGGNIVLHSLGINNSNNRHSRNRRVRFICRNINADYNCLLIRGNTPRQLLVYRSCRIEMKFFFLINSLIDSKPVFKVSYFSILQRFLYSKRLYEIKVISNSSFILANSPVTVREINTLFNRHADFVPTNSLSEKYYFYKPRNIRNEEIKLLFCGRIVREKGIEDIFNAIHILTRQGLICNLTLIGLGSNDYLEKLKNLAFTLSIGDHVYFKNYIPHGEELIDYHKQADIFVLPSWHEGFPRSIWEAAATCTPVITTPVGGITGLVSNKEVFFVPVRSPLAIAERIKEIQQEPEIVISKVKQLYNLALNYTAQRCAKSLADVIYSKWDEQ